MKTRATCAVCVFLLLLVPFAWVHAGYHVVKRAAIGGEGGWDYLTVDSTARRLYVSHGTRVVVLDADSLKVVGEIPKTEGVHGIAIAREFKHGFTSNGRTSTVTMFDLTTLSVIREVPAGKNPDAILYDPFSRRLFTFNGRSHDASVLDPSTGDSVTTIPLGGKPEFAVSDLNSRVYVNDEDNSQIIVIDTKTLTVLSRWPIAPGESPSGLAIDIRHRRLFSVCENKLMIVLDADNGHVIATLPIGAGVDGCAFDPGVGLAFSSNGEGTLTVIREETPATFSVVEHVATQRGARTIAVDLKTHVLFLPTAEFGPPPEPGAGTPRRPPVVPNSFMILKVSE